MGKMWFGTTDYAQWIDAPNTGADMSPEGWGSTGNLLNGGGWGVGSFGSHKMYAFEWKGSSAPRAAQLMKSYADGTYGRGLLYFIDPLIYELNILPARWADPSMTLGYEGGALIYGKEPQSVTNTSWREGGFPKNGVYYDLAGVAAGFRGREDALYIPIPEGYRLRLGAVYEYTGTGGVFYNAATATGEVNSSAVRVQPSTFGSANKVGGATISGVPGVWLWVGRSSSAASTLTLRSMCARLTKNTATAAEITRATTAPWIGGMGHSGCRFSGPPTYVATGGAQGGQAGYAASFIEVGSWSYG